MKITDSSYCQDKKILFSYGIISKRGYNDNMTDCEVDIILTHIPSGKSKRFHGTWYEKNYAKNMKKWIVSFPKNNKKVTVAKLIEYL